MERERRKHLLFTALAVVFTLAALGNLIMILTGSGESVLYIMLAVTAMYAVIFTLRVVRDGAVPKRESGGGDPR